LIDPNTARRITACLDLQPNQRIVEIGPGRGALTSILCAQGADLVVLEKDLELARLLRRKPHPPSIIVGDALQFDWSRLPQNEALKIIGNLPYNIASPLIWTLVSTLERYARMVFCVQREVARRMCAQPGSREYGALSVWVQSFASVHPALSIGRNVFFPRPKVDSAVIILTPLNEQQRVQDKDKLQHILRICFQKRRKQLSTILKSYWHPEVEAWLLGQDLKAHLRPENLSPRQFQELSSIIF
jgi:16S rRNA (adenine1518-N6/adenine1519-N6)-dimethyltransferase